jgi:hypothetical protein
MKTCPENARYFRGWWLAVSVSGLLMNLLNMGVTDSPARQHFYAALALGFLGAAVWNLYQFANNK